LAMNSPDVVTRLADKDRCFIELQRLGIAIPRTVAATEPTMLDQVPFPCLIKRPLKAAGAPPCSLPATARKRTSMRPI